MSHRKQKQESFTCVIIKIKLRIYQSHTF